MGKTHSSRDEALKTKGNIEEGWNVISASESIGVDDMFNEVIVPASGSITVTLPPVLEAKGREFIFVCVSDLGGTGVVVQDRDDAKVAAKNYATASNGIEKAGGTLHLYCNGAWYEQVVVDLS